MAGNPWAKPNVNQKVPLESGEQQHLITKLRAHMPARLHENVYAVPNGQVREVKIAKALKREGQSNGYPDLGLDVPRGPFHGFRCEMKRQNAVPSDWRDDQKQWAARLNSNGYLSVVAKGAVDAFIQFQRYWALGPYQHDTVVDLAQFNLKLKGNR